VYDSVAFEHESSNSLRDAFMGRKPAHIYSRITNPTVQDFEARIQALTGALSVLAVSSGMAAISNTLIALGGAGKNIITSRYLFGNTLSLFEKTFAAWGLEARYVSMLNPEELAQAIDDETCAVFLESITNPQLEVADCRALSTVVRERGVPLIVDNTLMTPYLFNCAEAGVDIEIISSTKYISGGATSVGGLVIDHGSFDWSRAAKFKKRAAKFGKMAFIAALRQEVYRDTGACLSPHNAYLQSLGLETMALRIDKSCRNAQCLAEILAQRPEVVRVNYPGLADSSSRPTASRQFGNKYGGVLTFDLNGIEECFSFMDALRVIRRATNINDNKSLILHPASTIFAEYSDEEKKRMAIRPTMLRLSTGIEDYEDLIIDLQKGFASL
ncbi:MAG TPA: O-acetylhomoserine aminocarboxypropyltransferase/cysteine synthase, partial [Desulfobacterales bacterium]|nr:O-acetylhomoserine aminocarboxypropyltransferase/cysteine synthase [Desulfobacterales bacterium]